MFEDTPKHPRRKPGKPTISTIVKRGPNVYNPDYILQFVRCEFCEQTSLDSAEDIIHHTDCPHSSDAE